MWNALKLPMTWFVVLAVASVLGPLALGVRPRTPREWWYIRVVLAFLALILPLMAALR